MKIDWEVEKFESKNEEKKTLLIQIWTKYT